MNFTSPSAHLQSLLMHKDFLLTRKNWCIPPWRCLKLQRLAFIIPSPSLLTVKASLLTPSPSLSPYPPQTYPPPHTTSSLIVALLSTPSVPSGLSSTVPKVVPVSTFPVHISICQSLSLRVHFRLFLLHTHLCTP